MEFFSKNNNSVGLTITNKIINNRKEFTIFIPLGCNCKRKKKREIYFCSVSDFKCLIHGLDVGRVKAMHRLEGVAPPAERVSCSLEGESDDEGDTWGVTVLRLCVVVPLPCASEADLPPSACSCEYLAAWQKVQKMLVCLQV